MVTSGQTSAAPAISVITVNFNMARDLERTIRSVAGQTFAGKEYIVVDGGSSDGSLEVIRRNSAALDRWISEPDRGIYDAMNKGSSLARGDWLLFLNSGDVFSGKDVLSDIFSASIPDESAILTGHAVIRYPDGGRRLWEASPPRDFVYGMICSHQAVLVRRSVATALKFNVDKSAGDYEFLLTCWRQGLLFHPLDMIISEVAPEGVSDRERVQSLFQRITSLRRAGLLSARLRLYYAAVVVLAFVTPGIKRALPKGAAPILRRIKGKHFTR